MSRTPDYHYIIRHVAECFRVQAYAFDTDLGLTCPETLPAPEKIYFLKTELCILKRPHIYKKLWFLIQF